MAPFSLMAAGVSWLAKSFSVLSCSSSLARCTSVLPAAYINPVKCVTTQASGPPKRPVSGYLRYVLQQQPVITRHNPEFKSVDIIRKIAQQWRMMSPEQKRPFQDASQRAREQFKVDLQRYKALLTPTQLEQQALEKTQRLAKRKALIKKRELTSLGKPKRNRSALNIFVSEHFEDAKGVTIQEKMKSLVEDWRNLLSHQKQIYTQLAEDDKIRYKNEISSWEDHMVEIGRNDLIREKTLPDRKKTSAAEKETKKAKAVKTSSATGKTTTRKLTKSNSVKTVRTKKNT